MKLILSVFVVWSVFARADVLERNSVRVISGLCNHEQGRLEGSGTLLKYRESLYVLTSEHVILHGGGEFCHFISNQSLGTQQATLKAVDWAMGLALLKLKGEGGISADQLAKKLPSQNSRIVVAGFPHGSKNPIVDNRGYVLLPEGNRHLVPLVSHMIELKLAHGEYGMSGGAVFSGDLNDWLGVLSHQYLYLLSGKKSAIGTFNSQKERVENHLLVIPSTVVAAWLDDVFGGEEYHPYFVRDPNLQILGSDTVFSSGLLFEMDSPEPGAPIGGNDGAGIGGNDGSGIGGNDGSGIGGEDSGATAGLKVRVRLDPRDRGTRWFLSSHDKWLPTVKGHLRRNHDIEIIGLIQKNRVQILPIRSLADLFKGMKNGLSPVTRIYSPAGTTDEDIKTVKQFGQRITKTLENFKSKREFGSLDAMARVQFQELSSAAVLAETNWELVDLGHLSRLLDTKKNQRLWSFLFGAEFEDAVDLLKDLLELRATLTHIKI